MSDPAIASRVSNMLSASPRKVCHLAPDVPISYPSGAAVNVVKVAASLHEIGHGANVIGPASLADALEGLILDPEKAG